ncbi:DUF6382 domain-containing protein [Paenibacillus sp. strain BS8-2]
MPYRIDFINGRGHEMTLDKDGGIRRSDLDELEINMLRSQRIPCLLPLEWDELDGNVTFRYALGGKKMLLHRLQQETFTMEQFYGLLLRVVSALIECREYMLRPEGCLLGDSFLFVGDNLEDLLMVYVPLKSRQEESINGDDLLALVARWTAYVDGIDGDGLRNVLQLFSNNRWPLAELRKMLLETIGRRYIKPAAKGDEVGPAIDNLEEAAAFGSIEYTRGRQSELELHARRLPQSSNESRFNTHNSELERISLEEDDASTSNIRRVVSRRWMVGLGLVLGSACIWRFIYLSEPTSQSMLISAGLSLLLIVGAVLLWGKGASMLIAPPQSEQDELASADSFELQSGPLLPMKQRWQMLSGYREPESAQRSGGHTTSSMGSYALPPQVEGENGGDFPYSTTPRAVLEPTTILGSAAEGPVNGVEKTTLRREWNGAAEEIPLLSDVFQIGRVLAGNGYEEKADGVSRMHLEILKEQGCHVAKDLGSRNGSLLNGTLMIPYKSYPLAAGDMIQLAGSKGPSFRFKKN